MNQRWQDLEIDRQIRLLKTVEEVLDYYIDNKKCVALLEQQRWGNKPRCPHCGYSKKIYKSNRGYTCGARNKCGKKFTVLVGTIYENTKIPLRYWFAAIYMVTKQEKISSYELAKRLGITQKSAYWITLRIKEKLEEQIYPCLPCNEKEFKALLK